MAAIGHGASVAIPSSSSNRTYLGCVHGGGQMRMLSDSGKSSGEDKNLGPEDFDSLDEFLLSIDTSFPEEKRAHVEALKKSIRGGPRSERSLYRDVPTQEEIEAIKFQGNFLPKIAPNAEELIDWALSHVPERAGPRRTRKAKRMQRRGDIKRADDSRRKTEKVAALARKLAKRDAHRAKANSYRAEAAKLRGETGTTSSTGAEDAKQEAA